LSNLANRQAIQLACIEEIAGAMAGSTIRPAAHAAAFASTGYGRYLQSMVEGGAAR
jgi:hypothetical protein